MITSNTPGAPETEVEHVQIEKYMGGAIIYLVTSSAGYHVVCTSRFE
jgi:hypothetical protein